MNDAVLRFICELVEPPTSRDPPGIYPLGASEGVAYGCCWWLDQTCCWQVLVDDDGIAYTVNGWPTADEMP